MNLKESEEVRELGLQLGDAHMAIRDLTKRNVELELALNNVIALYKTGHKANWGERTDTMIAARKVLETSRKSMFG